MTVLGACDRFEALLDRSQHHKPPQTKTPIACWFHAVRQSQPPWAVMTRGMTRADTKTQNFESAFVSRRDHTTFRQSPERFCLTPSGLRELTDQLRNTPDSRSGGILSPAQRLGARQRSEGALKLKISNRHSFRAEIILSSGNPLNGFV